MQVDLAKNNVDVNSSNNRISPYTKSFMEGTDHSISDPNTASSGIRQPRQSDSYDSKPPLKPSGTGTSPNTGSVQGTQTAVAEDSPYVPLPVAGSDMPISPYSCIEQAADDNAERGSRAEVGIRPEETVSGENEGTKCDGYVPWSSTQPSL